MELPEYPLASPLPTTAPHPRDVGRQLLAARQGFIPTCGYLSAEFTNAITCDVNDYCFQNTQLNNYYCCNAYSYSNLNCGIGQTSCIDSTAMAADCTGDCLFNTAWLKCTEGVNTICGVTRYDFSTIGKYLTGFSCFSEPVFVTAYDFYTSNGQQNYAAATPSIYSMSASSTAPTSPSASGTTPIAPTTPTTPVNPVPAANTNGLSGGAIAGIAIGTVAAIAIIAGLLVFIFLQKRRRDRQHQQNPPQNLNTKPPPMIQQQAPGSPPMNQQHMSMASMPSATSSTPLTQANIAAMSQSPPSEVLPSESASQIHSPGGGSILSGQGPPPTYHSGTGQSNTASQEHSILGPLPQGPQYPTGPSAFPHSHVGAPSVMSPGSAFGSIPPVHAPSVSPYGGS